MFKNCQVFLICKYVQIISKVYNNAYLGYIYHVTKIGLN